jgi:hypothetical protein
MTDHTFETEDLLKVLRDDRAGALEKCAKGTKDDFEHNRGVAEGLQRAIISTEEYFNRLYGPEAPQ